MHNPAQLRRAIMRRVWYTFMVSVVVRPSTVLGFFFGASVIGFWKLVSITSIANNLLTVQVGDLPSYTFHALAGAQTLALVAFGIIVFTILSVGIKLPRLALQFTEQQTQSA